MSSLRVQRLLSGRWLAAYKPALPTPRHTSSPRNVSIYAAPTKGKTPQNPPPKQASKTKTNLQAKQSGPVKAAATVQDDNGTWLIVGLGNPGKQYEKTRHNVGFMVIDELSRSEGIDCKTLDKNALTGKGEIGGKQVVLVKPQTFMNLSGDSVGALARFYKVPQSRVLVIADDLELDSAEVKLRDKGGHRGHNGLRSIMQHFQNSQNFPRIGVGIGRPPGQMAVDAYVLGNLSGREQAEMQNAIYSAVTLIRKAVDVGVENAMVS